MPLEKESLNNFLPDGFETNNLEGYKENFSADKIATGYEKDVKDRVSGPNFNNLLDVLGKNTNVLTKFMDFIKNMPINNLFTVDENNQLVYKNLDEVGGSGLEICDIGMALYVDESKGLRRYLNGQIVDINTNTQAFLNRLLEIKNTNPDYFTTEENWQAEALLNIDGCVYKFVLNYSGETVVSVRLPKYPDYVEINAGGTLPVVGNGTALGLTNGTENFAFSTSSYSYPYSQTNSYGVPVGTNVSNKVATGSYLSVGVTTDTTKSGIQTTLNQTKLKMRYFIQIATGSETENNIINDIELNNPYSLFDSKYSDHELNNLSWLKSEGQWNSKAVYPTAYDKLLKVYNGTETVEGLSVKLLTEEYTDYDFVLNTAEETFRLPLKTKQKFYDDIAPVVGNGMTLGLTDGTNNYGLGNENIWSSGYGLRPVSDVYGASAGTPINVNTNPPYNTEISIGLTSDPTKSGIQTHLTETTLYLYFYVGETVQNANLIDAGRIGEQLATKTDMLQASGASMPSSKYIDLTLGASGSTYTAPANGWFSCGGGPSTGIGTLSFEFNKGLYQQIHTNKADEYLGLIRPALKGDTLTINYTNMSGLFLNFTYAQGSEGEV